MPSQGEELGRWVKARRATLGLTQDQVWQRMELDIDQNFLAHLESGRKKRLPETDVLIALSMALKASMTDVLRGAGVLPEGIEESAQSAPGSQTIHALVNMIDWANNPVWREVVEDMLRSAIDRGIATPVRIVDRS